MFFSAHTIASTKAIAWKLKYLTWHDMPVDMTFDISSWEMGVCIIPKPFVVANERRKIVLIGFAKMFEIVHILWPIFISF